MELLLSEVASMLGLIPPKLTNSCHVCYVTSKPFEFNIINAIMLKPFMYDIVIQRYQRLLSENYIGNLPLNLPLKPFSNYVSYLQWYRFSRKKYGNKFCRWKFQTHLFDVMRIMRVMVFRLKYFEVCFQGRDHNNSAMTLKNWPGAPLPKEVTLNDIGKVHWYTWWRDHI